jgi:CRP-like cAMP-binding protein
MFTELHSILSRFGTFSTSEKTIIEQCFTYREVPKKFRLVDSGMVARELYFVKKGLIRLYYEKDGDEFTGFIFQENLFAGSFESFLTARPGRQILETLEDCKLLAITHDKLEFLYTAVPLINTVTRKIIESRLINGQKILASFVLDSPEERYKTFEKEHGDLLLRVPHHIIASYLGITPVSLSRIRNRILRDK